MHAVLFHICTSVYIYTYIYTDVHMDTLICQPEKHQTSGSGTAVPLPHSPLKSEDVGELIIKHMACTYQNNLAQNQKSIYLSSILIRVCTVSFFQGWHVWAKVIFFSQGDTLHDVMQSTLVSMPMFY